MSNKDGLFFILTVIFFPAIYLVITMNFDDSSISTITQLNYSIIIGILFWIAYQITSKK